MTVKCLALFSIFAVISIIGGSFSFNNASVQAEIPELFIEENPVLSSSEERLYKSPLRQIRDDGVLPQNVKCNEGKVLFFKIQTGSPLCIYESSIDRFDNTKIGWYDQNPRYHIELADREYLDAQNSNLERTTFVNYKKDTQNNNILYNLSEQITKQDTSFLIHHVVFDNKPLSTHNIDFLEEVMSNKRNYIIVDDQGNDPVDWTDPRTSVKTAGGFEDVLPFYQIWCGENAPIQYFYLNEEASFKILDGIETVHIQYPDKILTNYSETDTEFKDFVWSQGNAEFAFDKGLKEIAISEYSCTPSDGSLGNPSWNSTSYLYEVTFEAVN